jgi:tetratricopeptide (TPR) repeat protein
MNDFPTAIENYKKVCKINPNNVVAWYKLAFAYGQIGDLENSEKIYLKINNILFPHFAKTDGNLGTLYTQKQDYEKAKYYYEKALFFNPYDIDVLLGMVAIKLFNDRDIKGAKEYLERAMAINPEHEYVKYLIKKFPELADGSSNNTVINKNNKQRGE